MPTLRITLNKLISNQKRALLVDGLGEGGTNIKMWYAKYVYTNDNMSIHINLNELFTSNYETTSTLHVAVEYERTY